MNSRFSILALPGYPMSGTLGREVPPESSPKSLLLPVLLNHLTYFHHLPWIILGDPGICLSSPPGPEKLSSSPSPARISLKPPLCLSHSAWGLVLKVERLPRTNLNYQKEKTHWKVFQKINYLTNKCRVTVTWCCLC